eukprot:CAMPEP_0198286260 /NCGR_PEP_ID=MMETSP1449-20131203/5386_1 /TAXON_ID=420275 /ORGANISM="Attheya septentrionalis, Strain CCMP2084" /LENGTH=932 /DNA_ID=CAMNT_0043983949 /DNA_START=202 /DNA_END=3000 /DNA_ORIENTATION=+
MYSPEIPRRSRSHSSGSGYGGLPGISNERVRQLPGLSREEPRALPALPALPGLSRDRGNKRVTPKPRESSRAHISNGSTKSQGSQKSGDYQMINQSLQNEREAVRRARSSLASTLQRLGEHHVRNKNYGEAMNAFAQALEEKKNTFAHLTKASNEDESNHSDYLTSGRPSPSYGSSGTFHTAPQNCNEEDKKRILNEIVQTLSSMGNVHSLRGEHESAMKYYNEGMSIRAAGGSASNNAMKGEATSTSFSVSSFSLGLGIGEDDDSTVSEEMHEDMRALDDLLQNVSISSPHPPQLTQLTQSPLKVMTHPMRSTLLTSTRPESNRMREKPRRADMALSKPQTLEAPMKYPTIEASMRYPAIEAPNQHYHTETNENRNTSENPFQIESRVLAASSDGNELKEALEAYRSTIDIYTGQNLEVHENSYQGLAEAAGMLQNMTNKKPSDKPEEKREARNEELRLAIDIYERMLLAQKEVASGGLPMSLIGMEEPHAVYNQESASVLASTLIKMGNIQYKLNNTDEELRMYKEAKSLYEESFGKRHSYVAGTRKNIGMVLAERGEFDAAIEQFGKATKIYMYLRGTHDTSREIASALSCMGNVRNRMGDLDDSLAQYKEALRIYRSLAEKQHGDSRQEAIKDVTSTLKIMGMVHAKKGDLDHAMKYFRQAIEILKSCRKSNSATPGDDGTASMLTRVAGIYYKKGNYQAAMSNYQEAYDLVLKAHGTRDHPDIAGILHYIGGIHQKSGNLSEAMSCYNDAVRIYQSCLGAENPAVATTLVCIGSLHYKENNIENALIFYKEALRLNRNAYGTYHADVAPILKSMGMIHTKNGHYEEALEIFQEVLTIKIKLHGKEHTEVANAYKSIGNVLFKMDELSEAERYHRNAHSIYRRIKGEVDNDTVSSRNTIEHIRQCMREGSEQRVSRSSSGLEQPHSWR